MDKEIQPFSFLVAVASNFELLSCYNLCELIMINIRLAFWGPIQSVAMNKKWQGKGWQSHRWSFCHYLSSILSFFNRSVTFCGGGPRWWNAYFNWYTGGCGWTLLFQWVGGKIRSLQLISHYYLAPQIFHPPVNDDDLFDTWIKY